MHVITSNKNWIEGEALRQLEAVSKFPGIIDVVGFPDLHPGKGYPVGCSISSKNFIYPILIGNDIGCSMSLWKLNIPYNKYKPDKISKKIDGFDKNNNQLGTIGLGNHFLEFHSSNINESLYVIIHTGSRNLGDVIYRKITEKCGKNGLQIRSDDFNEYMNDHKTALDFAQNNHQKIIEDVADIFNTDFEKISFTTHNSITQYDDIFIHRKGASPSDQGLVIIPGSRGTYSYLVKPLEKCNQFLYSLNHGAGRKIARANVTEDKVKKTSNNYLKVNIICNDKDLIIEEAPVAYKNIDIIIDILLENEMIEVVSKMKPMVTFKSSTKE